MFKSKSDHSVVTTLIGESTLVKGCIDSPFSLHIEGRVEGEIKSQGHVAIAKGSVVKAHIVAKSVFVAGEVVGSIEVLSELEISGTGKVIGDLTGNCLKVQPGAIYQGKVNMSMIQSKNPIEGDSVLKL